MNKWLPQGRRVTRCDSHRCTEVAAPAGANHWQLVWDSVVGWRQISVAPQNTNR